MQSTMQPTWFGHVKTARDALVLFEACLIGTLQPVPRRLQHNGQKKPQRKDGESQERYESALLEHQKAQEKSERSNLIKSGCVFVYEEHASGIKRWTDGLGWTSSRVLGNFLVYREKERKDQPDSTDRSAKRPSNRAATRAVDPYPTSRPNKNDKSDVPRIQTPTESSTDDREEIRLLVGSLIDDCGCKEDGLVKKTMSVNYAGRIHRLVSYYTIEHALSGQLTTVAGDPRIRHIQPRPALLQRQCFRSPEGNEEFGDQLIYQQGSLSYGPEVMLARSASLRPPIEPSFPPYTLNSTPEDFSPSRHDSEASSFAPTSYSSSNFSLPSYGTTNGSFSSGSNYSCASYPGTQPSSQVQYSACHDLPTEPKQETYRVKQEQYAPFNEGEYSPLQKPPLSVCTENSSSIPQFTHYAGHLTPISASTLLPPPDALAEYGYGRGSVWSEDRNGPYQADTAYKLEPPRWGMVAQENL